MINMQFVIELLGLGLKRKRLERLLEEYNSDSATDPQAGRTALVRTLTSYFSVMNLGFPFLFFIAVVGALVNFYSMWIWAVCLLFLTLFISPASSDASASSKAFKLYKLWIGFIVLLATYHSTPIANTANVGKIVNLTFYYGHSLDYITGVIALIATIWICAGIRKSTEPLTQLQRLAFVIGTMAIYMLGSKLDFSSIILGPFITLLVFVVALIKRKPALA